MHGVIREFENKRPPSWRRDDAMPLPRLNGKKQKMSCSITKRGRWIALKKGDARRRIFGREYKYLVMEEYVFELEHSYPSFTVFRQSRLQEEASPLPMFRFEGKRLVVYPGYSWDGASGPAVDTRSSMAPSLMHDCAYQSIRMRRLKQDYRIAADIDFRELLRFEGMGKVWSRVRYWALRAFGRGAAKPE